MYHIYIYIFSCSKKSQHKTAEVHVKVDELQQWKSTQCQLEKQETPNLAIFGGLNCSKFHTKKKELEGFGGNRSDKAQPG